MTWDSRVEALLANVMKSRALAESGDVLAPVKSFEQLSADLKKVSPGRISWELTEMRFLGCVGCDEECSPLFESLTHHVDFPTTHEICDYDRRDAAILWATQHTGSFNYFRHYDYTDERVVTCVMRWSFSNEIDAAAFKLAFY